MKGQKLDMKAINYVEVTFIFTKRLDDDDGQWFAPVNKNIAHCLQVRSECIGVKVTSVWDCIVTLSHSFSPDLVIVRVIAVALSQPIALAASQSERERDAKLLAHK